MRVFATAAAVLAMATGASALSKKVTTIAPFTDPTDKAQPAGLPSGYAWSYYPNSFGTVCVSGPCCGGNNQVPCGPLNWATPNGIYPLCDPANGGQQTPINLDINEAGYSGLSKTSAIRFSKGKCAGEVTQKPGTWEVEFFDCETPFTVTVDGRKWQLWQMHVHTPSEHTVNGAYYPVEVHLVHIPFGEELNLNTVTQALVLGVFLSPGKTSNKILDIFTHYPADEFEHLWKAVNIYSLVPKSKAYWHYTGSLTTPPCQLATSGFNVQWYVFKEPTAISQAQLNWFSSYISELPLPYLGQNNRPIQPIEAGTTIYSYGKRIN